MVARAYNSSNQYRFGYNGKEHQDEQVGGDYDYGMRIHDSRICRFLSVDPLNKSYPWLTPYQFAGNTPIQAIDLDGAEPLVANANAVTRTFGMFNAAPGNIVRINNVLYQVVTVTVINNNVVQNSAGVMVNTTLPPGDHHMQYNPSQSEFNFINPRIEGVRMNSHNSLPTNPVSRLTPRDPGGKSFMVDFRVEQRSTFQVVLNPVNGNMGASFDADAATITTATAANAVAQTNFIGNILASIPTATAAVIISTGHPRGAFSNFDRRPVNAPGGLLSARANVIGNMIIGSTPGVQFGQVAIAPPNFNTRPAVNLSVTIPLNAQIVPRAGSNINGTNVIENPQRPRFIPRTP